MRVDVISVMVLLVLEKMVIVFKLIWLFIIDFVEDWNIVVYFCVDLLFEFKYCFWLVVINIKWLIENLEI